MTVAMIHRLLHHLKIFDLSRESFIIQKEEEDRDIFLYGRCKIVFRTMCIFTYRLYTREKSIYNFGSVSNSKCIYSSICYICSRILFVIAKYFNRLIKKLVCLTFILKNKEEFLCIVKHLKQCFQVKV